MPTFLPVRPALLFLLATVARAGDERMPAVSAPAPQPAPAVAKGLAALAQQAYVKASNPGGPCAGDLFGDLFGSSVAISGNTLVVGAPREDSSTSGVNGDEGSNLARNSGAAYVYVRDGAGWSQQAYLKASNPGGDPFCNINKGLGFPEPDQFGHSVAISGDTIVVGAPWEDGSAPGVNGAANDLAIDAGAAYVFVRDGATWTQQAYLKASHPGGFTGTTLGDWFGHAVAISGDTIVVGAPHEAGSATGVNGADDDLASKAGAAYVFVRSGSTWSQEAYLKPSTTGGGKLFGHSVGIAGDVALVGAAGESSSRGAAYAFARQGTSWSQEARLVQPGAMTGDSFGTSVAVAGSRAVVGAPGRLDDNGGVYVFARNGGAWSQEANLVASNSSSDDRFGTSLAISGDVVAVGAPSEDSGATGIGGDEEDDSAPSSGAAYTFVRNGVRTGSTWSQEAYVKASNTGLGDDFGTAVALWGCTLVGGAPDESSGSPGVNGEQDDDSLLRAGAAYVLERAGVVLFRNAGTNPASYAAGPIVIGGTFTATVDNGLASQTTARLFAFDTTFSLTLGGGQTLLGLDLGGGGEIFTGAGLAPSSSLAGVDSFALPFANEPTLCGLVLHSQAIQFGNPPFVLSNAQDLTIGSL